MGEEGKKISPQNGALIQKCYSYGNAVWCRSQATCCYCLKLKKKGKSDRKKKKDVKWLIVQSNQWSKKNEKWMIYLVHCPVPPCVPLLLQRKSSEIEKKLKETFRHQQQARNSFQYIAEPTPSFIPT